MNFRKMVEDTIKLDKPFKLRFDKRDRALDLAEEVGELVQAMQVVEKRKLTNDPSKQRSKEDIADALSDILYDLILLADAYGIDLETEYKETLTRLKNRIRKGEFDANR